MEAADFWNDPEVSQKKMKELKSMKDDVHDPSFDRTSTAQFFHCDSLSTGNFS